MSYSVTLYQYKNMPYNITDIDANSENEAIDKAKKFVATNGYFPGMKVKQIMDILNVEKVIKND